MCCVEPPSPCRLFTTPLFLVCRPPSLLSHDSRSVGTRPFITHTGPGGPTACILILRSEETVPFWGLRLMSGSKKNVKRSHLMCETLSDSESERRPSLGAFWKLLWLFSRGRCERICLLFSRTTSSVKYFVVWFDLFWQQMDKLQNWSVPSVDV